MENGDAQDAGIAEQIRELRKLRGLTQSELAEKSGLATNTLSLIERKETSPTVSTLQKIASALDVNLDNLFSPLQVRPEISYTKTYQRKFTDVSQGSLANLAPGFPGGDFYSLYLIMEPGAKSGSDVHHPGQEFVFCVKGQLLYLVKKRAYLLEPGDSLMIDSSLPHRWQNAGNKPVEALIIIQRDETKEEEYLEHFDRD